MDTLHLKRAEGPVPTITMSRGSGIVDSRMVSARHSRQALNKNYRGLCPVNTWIEYLFENAQFSTLRLVPTGWFEVINNTSKDYNFFRPLLTKQKRNEIRTMTTFFQNESSHKFICFVSVILHTVLPRIDINGIYVVTL